jgi:hypothetical protein
MSGSMLRKLLVFGLIAALVVIGGAAWYCRSEQVTSHAEMRDFLSRLDGTTTPEDVRRMMGGYKHIYAHEPERGPWSVLTPLSFDASNWVAWLDFENGKLARVRVRTYDSMGDRPKDGPPDRTFKPS